MTRRGEAAKIFVRYKSMLNRRMTKASCGPLRLKSSVHSLLPVVVQQPAGRCTAVVEQCPKQWCHTHSAVAE